jgi:hypothetical protein
MGGYNTELTKWPSSASPQVKELIDRLFRTLDDTGPGAGDVLADQVFAANGSIEGHHSFIGTERLYALLSRSCRADADLFSPQEIRRSRDKAWNVITSRRHEIQQVYVADTSKADDLMLRGTVAVELVNGKKLKGGFAARVTVHGTDGGSPRVSLYEVFAVSLLMDSQLASA